MCCSHISVLMFLYVFGQVFTSFHISSLDFYMKVKLECETERYKLLCLIISFKCLYHRNKYWEW